MRKPRVKLRHQTAVYHCYSRTVNGERLFDPSHKEKLRELLRRIAAFCAIQVITHCELDNHFHLEVRARLRRRMGEVSVFMKELKQCFSRWFNAQTGRFGTLWAERFGSVLVEDQPGVVGIVSAYLDLNAVRAGLVEDPKDYRFCGYAEAVAGDPEAQAGLMSFLGPGSWEEGAAVYRQRLYVGAGRAGQAEKALLSREAILAVVRQGGQIAPWQALRLRIRYLSDGLALGSKAFLDQVFAQFRGHFGPKRTSGPRRLRGLPFGELRCLRDLRVNVLS